MPQDRHGADRRTNWIRWVARIWSAPIILYSLLLFIGYSWDWATTGTADPYAVENVPFIESATPVLMFLSVIGMGLAWRWERLGGWITLGFQFAALLTLMLYRPIFSDFPRSAVPYLISLTIFIPGLLFLLHGYLSNRPPLSMENARPPAARQ